MVERFPDSLFASLKPVTGIQCPYAVTTAIDFVEHLGVSPNARRSSMIATELDLLVGSHDLCESPCLTLWMCECNLESGTCADASQTRYSVETALIFKRIGSWVKSFAQLRQLLQQQPIFDDPSTYFGLLWSTLTLFWSG